MSSEKNIVQRVTVIGAFFDLLLGIGKITVGKLYYSHALVVDGVHSLSDLLTDFFVIIVSRYSHEEPDAEHPYGHERFETLGTLVIGSVLFATAGAFFYENFNRLFIKLEDPHPTGMVIWMAAASVLVKELIYQYTNYWGKKTNSRLMLANAWHSRTDAISSVVVLIGALLAQQGIQKVDSVAAIFVSILIGKVGYDFIKSSLVELTDTGLDEQQRKDAFDVILKTDGVCGAHNFRTRWMGDKLYVDLNIEVSPAITVSEGHQIATWVGKRLKQELTFIFDVTVHTDIEDDMHNHHKLHQLELLPLRTQVLETLSKQLANPKILEEAKKVYLNYKETSISISLIFDQKTIDKLHLHTDEIKMVWKDELKDIEWFDKLKIFLEM
jgi:cation diffusion facilitator family transporter